MPFLIATWTRKAEDERGERVRREAGRQGEKRGKS